MMKGRVVKSCVIAAVVSLCVAVIAGCANEEFGGLGIEVPSGEGKVGRDSPYVIVSVYKGGTGDMAGLHSGDTILSVDGHPLKGMQHDYIVKNLLRGKPGSMVTLELERGGELMIFRVLRGKVVLKE
ncbi:MAG TPA: PDZ domain-containing protein [Spirochaetota bacterium]|nr:PDZ domain-containing protein [Spirochaetota bacterium]